MALEGTDKPLHAGIGSQGAGSQRPQEIDDVEGVKQDVLPEPSRPSLQPAIQTRVSTRGWVEGFFREHGILLDLETKLENGWEGVCERKDANCADETRDVRELGDGCGDDEGQRPVGGDHGNPEDLAHPDGERGSAEELLEDVIVDDLDTNVAVQGGSDETRDDVADVGSGLVVVWRETLHNGVECILALVAVDKDAEEHVNDIDEGLGADQAFPEVPGLAHLG